MGVNDEELLKNIRYYQDSLEKYSSNGNNYKLLSVIKKLKKLPIATSHLQNTGIGRTVNALRKLEGEVGDAAKALVIRWKEMVVREDVKKDETDDGKSLNNNKNEEVNNKHIEKDDYDDTKHKERDNTSSHRASDNVRTSEKEKSKSDKHSSGSKNTSHDKKDKDSHQHKHDRDNNSERHSSKYKHESETSESEEEKSHSIKDRNESEDEDISSDEVKDSEKQTKSASRSYKKREVEEYIPSKKLKHDNNNSTERHSSKRKRQSSSSESEEADHRPHSRNNTDHKSSNRRKDREDREKSRKKHKSDHESSSRHHSSKRKHHSSSSSELEEENHKHRNDSEDDERRSHSSKRESEDSKKHKSKSSRSDRHERKSKSKETEKPYEHSSKTKSSRSESSSRKELDSDGKSSSKHKKSSDDSETKELKSHSSHSGRHDKKDKICEKEVSKDKHNHKKEELKQNEVKEKTAKGDKELRKEKTAGLSSSKKENSKSSTSKPKSGEKNKAKPVDAEKITHGIDSESGASFAEALGMCGPMVFSKPSSSTKKKASSLPTAEKPHMMPSSSSVTKEEKPEVTHEKYVPNLLREIPQEPLQINISNLLPEITPHYRPVSLPLDAPKRMLTQDEALSQAISNKNIRTKVYSGNKVKGGEVPSLFNICAKVLQDNIDAIECTGGVPYIVLKTILEKATPDQLFNLEHYNPYLIEDTDELWRLHCMKAFRTKKREEMETWREMYMRCLDEREAKLNFITANIKESQDKSLPVRTTKLAYVDSIAKPPRNIAKRQAKNGIINRVPQKTSTSLKLSALATAGEASKVPVPNPGRRAVDRSSSSSSSAIIKPKKAPLMAKTLSLFKNRFKR